MTRKKSVLFIGLMAGLAIPAAAPADDDRWYARVDYDDDDGFDVDVDDDFDVDDDDGWRVSVRTDDDWYDDDGYAADRPGRVYRYEARGPWRYERYDRPRYTYSPGYESDRRYRYERPYTFTQERQYDYDSSDWYDGRDYPSYRYDDRDYWSYRDDDRYDGRWYGRRGDSWRGDYDGNRHTTRTYYYDRWPEPDDRWEDDRVRRYRTYSYEFDWDDGFDIDVDD